jgi:tape measure domain-containing protein
VANYVIRLIVENRGATAATAQVTRAIREAEKAAKDAQRQVSTLSNQVSGLLTLLAARQFIQLADTYTSIANKLKTVSNGHEDLRQNMERTFQIAQDNRVGWESLAKTYSRIQRSTRDLRLSQKEVADVTDTLTKAIQLSGATTAETNSVLIQFGQALSKGKLDGDEFKSIMENSVEIGNILTKSLGVTRGELMRMSKAGQITTSVIIKAFQEARREIVDRFGESVPTIGQRFTQLRNAIVKSIGESSVVLKPFGDLLGLLTKHADVLVGSVIVLGSVALGVKLVQGAQAATAAMQAFTLAMATNPVIAMAAAIAGLTMAAQGLSQIGPQTKSSKLGMGGTVLQSGDPTGQIRGSFNDVVGTLSGKRVAEDLEANLARLKKAIDEALDVTPMERFIDKMRTLTLVSDGLRAHWDTLRKVSVAMTEGVTEAVIKNVERAVKEAEKARREAEAFRTQFEAFHSSLSPAAAAAYELANGLDTLNEAIRRKMITVEQAAILYERLRESIAGVNSITHPNNLAAMGLDARFAPSAGLSNAAIDRTDLLLEQDAARTKVQGSKLVQDSLPMQAQILEELRGKEEDRKNRLVALNLLVAQGAITQTEYNEQLKKLTEQDMLEGVKKLDQALVLVFDNATDALADFLYTGEFGFRKMVDAMLRDISRLLAQQLVMGALGLASGNTANPIAAGAVMLGQKGFANGGTFMVGGTGGTDSQIVALRATPGESIQVATPQQQRSGSAPGGTGPNIQVVNAYDPRRMVDALNSPQGRRVISEIIRTDPGIIARRTK